MRSFLLRSLAKNPLSHSSPALKSLFLTSQRPYAKASRKDRVATVPEPEPEGLEDAVPTSGISRPLSEILKELSKRVPDSLVKTRLEDGFSVKYVPWYGFSRMLGFRHFPR